MSHPAITDGVLDVGKLWEPTAKNKIIRASTASNRLRVGGTGSSKALHVDTPIPTPQGWRRIRDLAIGDHVFDESGAVCRVTSITETMMHPAMRLVFDTNDALVADLGHQWHTFTFRERRQLSRRDDEHRANRQATRRRKGQAQTPAQIAYHRSRRKNPPKGNVWTTAEIAETLMDRDHTNHAIRLCGAIQMPDADLPIDPYVLGLWLGDGTTTTGIITTADPEVIEEIRKTGRRVVKTSSPYAWRVVGLTTELSALYGIPLHRWNRKCIPDVYMRGSIEQRLALLQGLMDADGCADQRAGCGFANTNRELINAVFELAVSLGIKATVQESRAVCNGKDCGPSWRVAWTSSLPVFRLSRKLSRLNDKRRTYTQDFRYIVAAEDAGIQPVCCISVDSPSHLYLAGRAMIPTHNSSDAMMEMVTDYLLRFPGCFGLILRTTMPELERTNIPNFKAYVPAELYTYNETKHIVTFYNGSKLFFSHMQHFTWKDMEAYQSSSFPVIFLDECGGIPMSVWLFFQARNRVNPECKPDAEGNWPIPCMMGATNPIGAYWAEYADYFVTKKPDGMPEGTRKDRHGRMWSPIRGEASDPRKAEDWRLEYDPYEWDYIQSTIFDNPHLLAKDPGIVDRLNRMPKELREKLLDGRLDTTVGQYFDVFDPNFDVINLREDPDAIIFQYWQPRWLGWDWGRAHWNAVFWFTKALVRRAGGEYRLKTVLYREYVDRGRDYIEMAEIVKRLTLLGLPGATDQDRAERKGCDYRAAYFSHEKFAKQMESESPASKLTKYLMDRGMTGVTRGTTDRVGRATLLYHLLKNRELVILDSCPEIIRAIPQCTRDEKNPEDVLKVDTKGDDCYDGASLGLFGELGTRPKPQEEVDREKLAAVSDSGAKVLLAYKLTQEREKLAWAAEERRGAEWE